MACRSIWKVVRLRSLSSDAIAPIFLEWEMRYAVQTRGRIALTDLYGLDFIRLTTRGGAFEMHREEMHVRRAKNYDFFACIPLKGSVTLSLENHSYVLGRGDIGLLDSGLEYRLALPENFDALWVRIPRGRLEARLNRPETAAACRIDGSSGTGMIASSFILNCASQVDRLKDAGVTSLSSIIIDMLCAAAIDAHEAVAPRRKPSRIMTLERAKDFIEHHLGDEELSPSRVAAAIGISTRYLGELFAHEGQSPMAWITDRRLKFCRRALEIQPWTSGAITEIAFRYGFSHLSSFNRIFKAAFGNSPRSFMPK